MTDEAMSNEMEHSGNGANHDEDIFEDLTNVESRFYSEGYQAGHAHGALHGLFEGRELGREKAWEIWEEVGFYEGFAGFWRGLLRDRGVQEGGRGKESRAMNHAKILLDLISKFPTTNPSDQNQSASKPPQTGTADKNDQNTTMDIDHAQTPSPTPASASATSGPDDLPSLLGSIRARYRLLCSSLGVRPRLTTAPNTTSVDGDGESADGSAAQGAGGVERSKGGVEVREGVVQGIEGPMKGVDTRQLRF